MQIRGMAQVGFLSAMIWAAHFQADADPGAMMEPSANSSRSEVAQVQAPVGHRQPTQNDLPPSVREEEAPNAKAGQQQEFEGDSGGGEGRRPKAQQQTPRARPNNGVPQICDPC